MADRNVTRFSFAAAVLAVIAVLSPGLAAMQAQAQDLPGTDCSRLLAAEQTECIRTMRRLELRRMEEEGSVTAMPDQAGSAIQSPTVPTISGNPSSPDPMSGRMGLPSDASGRTGGK